VTGDKLRDARANPTPRCFAARWIFPIARPPIQDGWLRIEGERIVDVRSDARPAEAEDLGDVVLLPCAVNAHTHLEFSDCPRPIGQVGTPLSEWIGQVVAARGGRTRQRHDQAIKRGLEESQQAGVCLIGEIATPPCEYPASMSSPEIYTFAEVLGLSQDRSDERLAAAAAQLAARTDAGISPHAPYSTSREAIASCLDLAIRNNRIVAMHVAESPAERELLVRGSGPFAAALKSLGVWRDGLFPWSDHPVIDLINQLSAAPRALLVHGNDLTDAEIELLARYPQMTVVYCPRTHAFFQYDRHPVDRLLAAGVRIALGTDSRASNPDLNLWREVQHLFRHRPDLDPAAVLAMATMAGADALGRPDLGRIETGACARLGTVATSASHIDDVFADLAEHEFLTLPLTNSASDHRG
jgi:cytosine/adenosine deaminase-related metal-dependent hydrolase